MHVKAGLFLVGNGKRQSIQKQDTEVQDFRASKRPPKPFPKCYPAQALKLNYFRVISNHLCPLKNCHPSALSAIATYVSLSARCLPDVRFDGAVGGVSQGQEGRKHWLPAGKTGS